MSDRRGRRHVLTIATVVVGLMLTMLPLPDAVRAFRPDWVALILIFWALAEPRRYGVGTAWVIGLIVDEIAEILSIPEDEIESSPANVNGVDGRFFEGVYATASDIVVILNLGEVLSE